MKAHLTKVSVAFLFAALVLGCQEQASSPVGLEGLVPQFHAAHVCQAHNKNDEGCGGSAEGEGVKVTLDGGIMTFEGQPQPAKLTNDSRTKVVGFSCCGFFATLNLTPDLGVCTLENTSGSATKVDLATFLTTDIDGDVNELGDVHFGFQIQLRKMNGGLYLDWLDDDGLRVRVNVRSDDVFDGDDGTGTTTFTFTGREGGVEEVTVSRSILGGSLSEKDRLSCQYPALRLELLLDRNPTT